MTAAQKIIKYAAIALAVFLAVSIIGGILSVVSLFAGASDEAVADDLTTYAVSSEITALDIHVGAADFTIKQAPSFSVESNLKNLTVKEKDGALIIREEQTIGRIYDGAVLTLCVPEQTVFRKAEITTGAGRLTADILAADVLRLELGAGEVTIDTLSATSSADIDGGSGKITIGSGTLCNLDLDMGIGQFNLTSAVTGKSEMDFGIGETNLVLIGSKADYALDMKKGIGSITVDGKDASDFGSSGNGQNRIDINGGIGTIRITFQ